MSAFKHDPLSRWSELDEGILYWIWKAAERSREETRTLLSSRRTELPSAGLAEILPVCQSWRKFASKSLRRLAF